MSAPLLEIEGLRTWIDQGAEPMRAVEGLSLSVGRGETFALVGESGCGKSITALSVMRLLPDSARIVGGRVRLDGVDLTALAEAEMREWRGRRVSMIFQEPMLSLNPVLTVERQVAETLQRHAGLEGEALRQRVLELLDSVGLPDARRRMGEYPFQLSGGLRQRVMIAIALACDPDLLIADEPTTALDVTIQAQVLDLLRRLQKERGMSVLLITHDLGVVAEMASSVAVMYAGEVVERASSAELFRAPRHPYSRKLFGALPERARRGGELAVIRGSVPRASVAWRGCRFADRCDHAWQRCRDEAPRMGAQSSTAVVRCHLYDDPAPPIGGESGSGASAVRAAEHADGSAPALLSVRGLQVHFPIQRGVLRRTVGHVKAVDGVSFEIAPGRTLALVGESGCGKTTTGKALLRLIEPTGGSVGFDQRDLLALRGGDLRARRRDMQIIFQDPFASLNPRMRVAEIIEEGMVTQGVGADGDDRRQRIDALLAEVGLDTGARDRYPHEFSGGQRQRIAIARALAVQPRLIVCDEPTSALDVSVQAQILNLLLRLQRDRGIAYLFITHNIAVVEYLAHEVAVMYLGRIVEQGPAQEVLSRPRHPYTRALLSAVPTVDPNQRRGIIRLPGDLPSPAHPPAGCHFHPRCGEAHAACMSTYPDAHMAGERHVVRCHLLAAKVEVQPAPAEENVTK